jgi:hypothetical protein
MGSDGNFNQSNGYSKDDFMVRYGNVSNNSDDTWKSGLELYDNEQMMSTNASILVDSVGPPGAEVCRIAASFP